MTEAYAIKGPDGIDASSVQETESECWLEWYVATEMGQDMSERHGYTCVPVTVSEKGEVEALLKAAKEYVDSQHLHQHVISKFPVVLEPCERCELNKRIDAYLSRGQG